MQELANNTKVNQELNKFLDEVGENCISYKLLGAMNYFLHQYGDMSVSEAKDVLYTEILNMFLQSQTE